MSLSRPERPQRDEGPTTVSDTIANRALVSGRVQGVTFRQSCRQEARRLGLVGWVRNRTDGVVEVFVQGPSDRVERLIEWLWHGPPHARVTGVESDVVALDANIQDFLITN
jgi:acylphosphatase